MERIGVLVGACLPHCSLKWCHDEVTKVGDTNRLKIEIKKEMVHQQNYSGVGLVVYGVEQESENIDKKLMESFKNNDLDLQHVSFKMSSKEGKFNTTRMNYQNNNEMCFEVLKGLRLKTKQSTKKKREL